MNKIIAKILRVKNVPTKATIIISADYIGNKRERSKHEISKKVMIKLT